MFRRQTFAFVMAVSLLLPGLALGQTGTAAERAAVDRRGSEVRAALGVRTAPAEGRMVAAEVPGGGSAATRPERRPRSGDVHGELDAAGV